MIEANTTGSVTKECAVTGHVCVNSNVFYETKTDSPFAALHSDCLSFFISYSFFSTDTPVPSGAAVLP